MACSKVSVRSWSGLSFSGFCFVGILSPFDLAVVAF
jgi:hypothetical protein